MYSLIEVLKTCKVASPFPFNLASTPCLRINLSRSNRELARVNTQDSALFCQWINQQLKATNSTYAAGGYGEDRAVYEASTVFANNRSEARTLHLGVDLWTAANTPVFCVLGGVVHSLGNHSSFGDYGPTVIMEHHYRGQRFYTLYGHLALATLEHLRTGQRIETGQLLGWLGPPEVNGGWPPHLHYQIIADIGDYRGDFPGVCTPSTAAAWLLRCPNPNHLLHIPVLA